MGRLDMTCPDCGGAGRPSVVGDRRQCLDCNKTYRPRPKTASEAQTRGIHDRLARSAAQESRNARELGGRRTLASGATKLEKSDVVTSTYGRPPTGARLECKTTNKASRSVSLAELRKIASEAKGDEIPILALELTSATGLREEFYIIPKDWAQRLLEEHYGRDSDD